MVGMGFGIFSLLAGLYTLVKGWQLSSYLKENKYERWREISTIDTPLGKIGPGAGDSFKTLRYIKSDLDNEDENILRLKDSAKIGTRYMGILFLAFLVTMGLVVALVVILKK